MFPELIVPILLTVGFLAGIRLMQSPRTALWGNRLGALCMALAIVFALEAAGFSPATAWLFLLLGGVAGIALGQKVKMIEMPQTVALFNGLGGGASALVAVTAMAMESSTAPVFFWLTAALALAIGTLTFSGSAVAALKLQAWITQRPWTMKHHGLVMLLLLLAGIFLLFMPLLGASSLYHYLLAAVFALYGVLMAMRIGGADMPVIISFLNSFSGVAAAVSGLAVGNLLLSGVGALVGVAGLILTQLMCRAMNRNLAAVLAGFKPKPAADRKESPADGAEATLTGEDGQQVAAAEDAGEMEPGRLMREAERVIVVPGYGMALAQAQQAVKNLIDALESDGKEVLVGIHPVAGRMPGHMNVLLAEAGLDYEKLRDMDEINPLFPDCDLVVVVGASDVINPAATTAEGTPIYGMPVLHVSGARAVIVCNLDEKPGYSGVDNTLYGQDHVVTIWGDAATTVPGLLQSYRDGDRGKREEEVAAAEEAGELEPGRLLRAAERVIVVPGYGMALAQAQQAVKSLIDALESDGREVLVGIHPVAGRMPGHMNVLLAEAGLDYEKLRDMDEINPLFPDCDLVVVVGASDVINPAAATAEGTPIYGMPVLHVSEARAVIVCNLDEKPGYSGVDNTLYGQDHVVTIWGDAASTVPEITAAYRG